MIEVSGVSKYFGTVKAVNGFSAKLATGVIGLVGENGAGKSTLFRLISGVYQSDAGSIMVDGFDCQSKEAKARVFFLSDDPLTPHGMDALETLRFYQGLGNFDEEEFKTIISRFGLPMNRPIASTFSKGMRRQAFIALALSSTAPYLLLDEAFDGLDPLSLETIRKELIRKAKEGKTIIISTHNVTVLHRLADRFLLLSNGRLTKDGDAQHLGVEFIKYQAVFPKKIEQEDLVLLGYRVVSFRYVGSVCHYVVLDEKRDEAAVREAFKAILLETVPIDPDELMALEMLLAKTEGGEVHA